MTTAQGALAILVLLAGFPLLALLPNGVASIQVAGLSLLWWYGGVLAPVAALVIAVASAPGAPPAPDGE